MNNPYISTWDCIYDYFHKWFPAFVCWFVFLLITGVVVGVSIFLITEVEHQREDYPAETVVKIYMNDQDSIVPILHEGCESLTKQIKDSREDSIDVKVVKKKVNE